MLIKANANDILKSRHPSNIRYGALCEKGNFVFTLCIIKYLTLHQNAQFPPQLPITLS